MKVSLRDGFEYIPKWNGNKKLPENEQIKVYMKFQTGVDMIDSVVDGKVDQKIDWLSMCKTVENLEVNGEKATPLDICDRGGFYDLYLELREAYKSETAINKKK